MIMSLDSIQHLEIEYKCGETEEVNLYEVQELCNSVLVNIERIFRTCSSITEIDGENADIVGLKLVGKRRIDEVVLTYVAQEAVSITYTLEEFYEL